MKFIIKAVGIKETNEEVCKVRRGQSKSHEEYLEAHSGGCVCKADMEIKTKRQEESKVRQFLGRECASVSKTVEKSGTDGPANARCTPPR